MLVVMEGHGRYRLLGQTLDDAAGEAFDKVARFLGLGYPGGPAIDHEAMSGDPEAIRFPRSMLDDGLDFSFSGLKTSVVNHVRKHPDVVHRGRGGQLPGSGRRRAGGQGPTCGAEVGATALALGGGVAANSLLREQFLGACADDGLHGFLPSRSMCTDNAAMIAVGGLVPTGERWPDPARPRSGPEPATVDDLTRPLRGGPSPGPVERMGRRSGSRLRAERFAQQAVAVVRAELGSVRVVRAAARVIDRR